MSLQTHILRDLDKSLYQMNLSMSMFRSRVTTSVFEIHMLAYPAQGKLWRTMWIPIFIPEAEYVQIMDGGSKVIGIQHAPPNGE